MSDTNAEIVQEELQTQEELNEQMRVRREKLEKLREMGIQPFEHRYSVDTHSTDILNHFEEYEGKTVHIAGRLMTLRGHGKTAFVHLADELGRIQVYFRKDVLGDQAFEIFDLLDIGDILGVEGEVFRTQKGEISVRAESFKLLSKSLRPLPGKWHD